MAIKTRNSSSIKNIKPVRSNFKQGYFIPQNVEKYKGPPPVIYRSGWELTFMQLLDTSPNVLEWASEPIGIEYVNPLDNKIHTYYVDFYFSVASENNSIRKILAEIKPSKQLEVPRTVSEKRQTVKKLEQIKYESERYITNVAKFEAAESYAKMNGMEFVVITEKFLYNKNSF